MRVTKTELNVLLHSMSELRKTAKVYNVKIGSRPLYDIIGDIVKAREMERMDRELKSDNY